MINYDSIPECTDMLKTDVSGERKEILNFPIEALSLSKEVKAALIGVKDSDTKERSFKTVGDLLKQGKRKVSGSIAFSNKNYPGNNMIGEIEDALAYLGLKFKDTDYTVYKMPVSKLKVRAETKKFLKEKCKSVKYIDDLIIQNVDRLKISTNGDYSVLKDLKEALQELGVKFTDSAYKLDKSKFFPLDDYAEYLSDKAKTVLLGTKRKKIRARSRCREEGNILKAIECRSQEEDSEPVV